MENEKLLHEEIKSELEALQGMDEVGTETYKVTVDGLAKLMDRAIEIDKLNIEAAEKAEARKEAKEAREFEQSLKVEQMEEDRIFKIVGHVLTGAGIVIPAALAIWGTNKSLKFEETGTVTTMAGRSFINKLFSRK